MTNSPTSRLLIDEAPLQVLPSLAVAVGLNEAIFLQQVHYWLNTSGHERDGRRWVYNSYPDWQQQFPFWSLSTIRRIIEGLEKLGVLVAGNYNASNIDRTKWYTLDYAALDALGVAPAPSVKNARPSAHSEQTNYSEWTDQVSNMSRPIPETNTETNNQRERPRGPDLAEPVPPPVRAVPKAQSLNGKTSAPKTPIPAWFGLIPAILAGQHSAPAGTTEAEWATLRAWVPAHAPNVRLGDETEGLVDWAAANPDKARYADWLAFWRNCMRRAQEKLPAPARSYRNPLTQAHPPAPAKSQWAEEAARRHAPPLPRHTPQPPARGGGQEVPR